MTIQQIQYVLEVYRSGSISRAAQKLFVAQPNLSNAIRSMEEDLGFALFTRSSKGVRPTEKGMLVLTQAGQIWEAYQKMMIAGRQDSACQLRVGGVAYSPVIDAFVSISAEYQTWDGLDFRYLCSDISENLEALRFSQLDVVLALVPEADCPEFCHRWEEKGIVFAELAEIPAAIQIGSKHPLYSKKNVDLSSFCQYTLVDDGMPLLKKRSEFETEFFSKISRRVTVQDRAAKEALLRETQMFGISYQQPRNSAAQDAFRYIPLEALQFRLLAAERDGQRRQDVCQQFLDRIQKNLQTL